MESLGGREKKKTISVSDISIQLEFKAHVLVFMPLVHRWVPTTRQSCLLPVCCFILLFLSRPAQWLITGLHNYSTITVCAMWAFNRRNISLISPQLSACSLYRNRTCNNCIMPSAAGPEWPRALRTLAAL